MRRRRVIAGLVVLGLVGVAAVALWPRGPRPCRETFEQVREGMTRADVYATVGGPPGDYAGDPPPPSHHPNVERWRGPDAELLVEFDREGRVAEAIVLGWRRPKSNWDRLRARLGL